MYVHHSSAWQSIRLVKQHLIVLPPAVNQLLVQRETVGVFLKVYWFGFTQQRITGIYLTHQLAARHGDKMTPKQVVSYAKELNDEIYQGFIKVK